jgi:hypothetical protein
VESGARVEAARECDSDTLACRNALKDLCHGLLIIIEAYNSPRHRMSVR